jgi:hypothetical protein
MRPREAALARESAARAARLSGASVPNRVASRPRERPPRKRAQARWLPSEVTVGIFLLILGFTLAVLLLTGVVRLAFAP